MQSIRFASALILLSILSGHSTSVTDRTTDASSLWILYDVSRSIRKVDGGNLESQIAKSILERIKPSKGDRAFLIPIGEAKSVALYNMLDPAASKKGFSILDGDRMDSLTNLLPALNLIGEPTSSTPKGSIIIMTDGLLGTGDVDSIDLFTKSENQEAKDKTKSIIDYQAKIRRKILDLQKQFGHVIVLQFLPVFQGKDSIPSYLDSLSNEGFGSGLIKINTRTKPSKDSVELIVTEVMGRMSSWGTIDNIVDFSAAIANSASLKPEKKMDSAAIAAKTRPLEGALKASAGLDTGMKARSEKCSDEQIKGFLESLYSKTRSEIQSRGRSAATYYWTEKRKSPLGREESDFTRQKTFFKGAPDVIGEYIVTKVRDDFAALYLEKISDNSLVKNYFKVTIETLNEGKIDRNIYPILKQAIKEDLDSLIFRLADNLVTKHLPNSSKIEMIKATLDAIRNLERGMPPISAFSEFLVDINTSQEIEAIVRNIAIVNQTNDLAKVDPEVLKVILRIFSFTASDCDPTKDAVASKVTIFRNEFLPLLTELSEAYENAERDLTSKSHYLAYLEKSLRLYNSYMKIAEGNQVNLQEVNRAVASIVQSYFDIKERNYSAAMLHALPLIKEIKAIDSTRKDYQLAVNFIFVAHECMQANSTSAFIQILDTYSSEPTSFYHKRGRDTLSIAAYPGVGVSYAYKTGMGGNPYDHRGWTDRDLFPTLHSPIGISLDWSTRWGLFISVIDIGPYFNHKFFKQPAGEADGILSFGGFITYGLESQPISIGAGYAARPGYTFMHSYSFNLSYDLPLFFFNSRYQPSWLFSRHSAKTEK